MECTTSSGHGTAPHALHARLPARSGHPCLSANLCTTGQGRPSALAAAAAAAAAAAVTAAATSPSQLLLKKATGACSEAKAGAGGNTAGAGGSRLLQWQCNGGSGERGGERGEAREEAIAGEVSREESSVEVMGKGEEGEEFEPGSGVGRRGPPAERGLEEGTFWQFVQRCKQLNCPRGSRTLAEAAAVCQQESERSSICGECEAGSQGPGDQEGSSFPLDPLPDIATAKAEEALLPPLKASCPHEGPTCSSELLASPLSLISTPFPSTLPSIPPTVPSSHPSLPLACSIQLAKLKHKWLKKRVKRNAHPSNRQLFSFPSPHAPTSSLPPLDVASSLASTSHCSPAAAAVAAAAGSKALHQPNFSLFQRMESAFLSKAMELAKDARAEMEGSSGHPSVASRQCHKQGTDVSPCTSITAKSKSGGDEDEQSTEGSNEAHFRVGVVSKCRIKRLGGGRGTGGKGSGVDASGVGQVVGFVGAGDCLGDDQEEDDDARARKGGLKRRRGSEPWTLRWMSSMGSSMEALPSGAIRGLEDKLPKRLKE